MTVTLVGSRAMENWFPDARKPGKDWDWISPGPDDFTESLKGDLSTRHDVFTDGRLSAWHWGETANPNELYTLKISHSSWEVKGPENWDKHARDIIFLSRKGSQFIRTLYDILLPIWREKYKRNPVSLERTAGQFFDDAVDRRYDHDSLHETVAYGERPLYEAILRDGETVAVDNSKFLAMDHATKIQLIREEIYATALERKLIPDGYTGSPGAAYWWALRRTVTSLFKGEWSLFVMLNLDELARPDCDYMGRHLSNSHMLRLNRSN